MNQNKQRLSLKEVEQLADHTATLGFKEFIFHGKGYLIYLDETVIGALEEGWTSKNDPTLYEIEQLEILPNYQNQGYGTAVLELLKQANPELKTIKGLSCLAAVSFWEKQGAEFEETCVTCSYEECPFHPAYTKPEFDEEDETACTDYCEDYSEYHFTLSI